MKLRYPVTFPTFRAQRSVGGSLLARPDSRRSIKRPIGSDQLVRWADALPAGSAMLPKGDGAGSPNSVRLGAL
jgi:hypothetical protein